MRKILVLATRNEKKRQELHDIVRQSGWTILTLREFPSCPDVVEDGHTFLENARKKAIEVSIHTGHITLADDSGLEVDALNGAPGIYSARYSRGENSTDQENLLRVLDELKEVPDEQRTARFVCAAVIANGTDVLYSTQQSVEGIIIHEPRGDGGFGYDPIFYYPPFQQTFAEIPSERKHTVSHRGKALRGIVEFLLNYNIKDNTTEKAEK